MRQFTKYGDSSAARANLALLADSGTAVPQYRDAFRCLGEILGQSVLMQHSDGCGRMVLACAAEDADWLASGVLSVLGEITPLAVFWNDRVTVAESADGKKTEISPIVKFYLDSSEPCDTLIIVKSIINTSCVVKTQLMRLLDVCQPQRILILAPVMFRDADQSLRDEFPQSVSSKMEFLALAIDDEREGSVVLPGVGGMVYPRLGLGDGHTKNAYMPNLVWSRML